MLPFYRVYIIFFCLCFFMHGYEGLFVCYICPDSSCVNLGPGGRRPSSFACGMKSSNPSTPPARDGWP